MTEPSDSPVSHPAPAGQPTLASRRKALARGLAAAAALVLALPTLPAAAEPLRVALLTPGQTNDGSFNQAARVAIERLAAEGRVVFELREGMHDPAAAEPVIRQYAARGYDLILGHGINLSGPILAVAPAFPQVHFGASGGLDLADRLQPNVNGWTYDFRQQGYLGGFIAARLEGVDVVGAVGGPELPFITAAHAGFRRGFLEGRPEGRILEIFTGSFDDAQVAAEVTRGMIAQGARVVWTSGDGIGNGVAAAAAQSGGFTIGVTGEAGGFAPQVNISSVLLDMYPTFLAYVEMIEAGTFGDQFLISGIGNRGLVPTDLRPLGGLVPEGLAAEVEALVRGLGDGSIALPEF